MCRLWIRKASLEDLLSNLNVAICTQMTAAPYVSDHDFDSRFFFSFYVVLFHCMMILFLVFLTRILNTLYMYINMYNAYAGHFFSLIWMCIINVSKYNFWVSHRRIPRWGGPEGNAAGATSLNIFLSGWNINTTQSDKALVPVASKIRFFFHTVIRTKLYTKDVLHMRNHTILWWLS